MNNLRVYAGELRELGGYSVVKTAKRLHVIVAPLGTVSIACCKVRDGNKSTLLEVQNGSEFQTPDGARYRFMNGKAIQQ